jgi:acetyltransferase
MSELPLSALFEPKAVAVIGASKSPDGVGYQVLQNIRQGGFTGSLYALDDQPSELAGTKAYARLADLPERVDLAVVAVPAASVPDVLRECGERHVKFAVVLSAGPAEGDELGKHLLAEARQYARRCGLRVVGPNCLGIMRSSVKLNASISRGIGQPGGLALVSQSGALCSAIVDWAELHNLGFSTVAALGAASDIGFGEVLDYLALDEATRAILLYVEGVDHARRFLSGLRAAARAKPVIVVKAARHATGGGAALSHSALVGDDAVFDAALRRTGAVRVARTEHLLSTAELLSHGPRPRGERLAIVTNSGALGILAVDRMHDLGLPLAPLSAATLEGLAGVLPAQAARANPIDVSGDAPPARYRAALELCLADPQVDAVLALLSPQWLTQPIEVAEGLAASARAAHKPLLTCFMGGAQMQAARARLAADKLPSFDSPEAAVEAFGYLISQRRNQTLATQPPAAPAAARPDVEGARLIIEAALAQGRNSLSQLEAKAVLKAFGVRVAPALRARSADEALVAAQSLGFPVAMKIDSPDISHKSEVHGVRLNVASSSAVRGTFHDLSEDVRRQRPEARLDGVIVEAMLARPEARELFVGVARDPAFGPAIAFGAGGKLVELLGPPVLGLPPLTASGAEAMLNDRKCKALLGDFHELKAVDRSALREVLLRVSDLICELPEVLELDINPLIADAAGALALDARIRVAHLRSSARSDDHLAIAPYPHHLTRTLQLPDGTSLQLRPIRSEDVHLEEDFVSKQSLESRIFRFMHVLTRLTPEMLVQFTQLDYDRELALLVVRGDGAEEELLGIARYIADPDQQGCEFAVAVADAWQKRGVGTLLMGALIAAAREKHLRVMHGDVLADNRKMLDWMARLGFSASTRADDPMIKQVVLRLD